MALDLKMLSQIIGQRMQPEGFSIDPKVLSTGNVLGLKDVAGVVGKAAAIKQTDRALADREQRTEIDAALSEDILSGRRGDRAEARQKTRDERQATTQEKLQRQRDTAQNKRLGRSLGFKDKQLKAITNYRTNYLKGIAANRTETINLRKAIANASASDKLMRRHAASITAVDKYVFNSVLRDKEGKQIGADMNSTIAAVQSHKTLLALNGGKPLNYTVGWQLAGTSDADDARYDVPIADASWMLRARQTKVPSWLGVTAEMENAFIDYRAGLDYDKAELEAYLEVLKYTAGSAVAGNIDDE